MFRGTVKGTGYPLHSLVSPSLPLPCVTVCHNISTGVCHFRFVHVAEPMPVLLLSATYCSVSRRLLAALCGSCGTALCFLNPVVYSPTAVEDTKSFIILIEPSTSCRCVRVLCGFCYKCPAVIIWSLFDIININKNNNNYNNNYYHRGTRLRHSATSRKVAGSISDGVIGIFH